MFKKNIFKVIELKALKLWSLDEVKNYLRVSHNYDNEIIQSLIGSAIDSAENFLGLSLHRRTVVFTCNLPGKRGFHLKFHPVIEVSEVSLKFAENVQELSKEDYYLDPEYSTLYLKQALGREELKIIFSAGSQPSEIPDAIKQGILLHTCAMYDRENDCAAGLSNEIKNLYYPYKKMRL